MAPLVHSFDWPDRVVVGTVGAPGSRSFYLQARSGRRLVSIGLEKEQSKALADKIEEVLDELMAQEGNPASVPAATPVELVDNDPLEQPVEPEFRTGVLSLGWDPSTAQVVIQAFPIVEVEVDDDADEIEIDLEDMQADEMLLVRIPVGTARAFAKRTLEVVGAGRVICMFCGEPMDAAGHVCHLPDGLE
ncbi:DUF3090 domain-containing protein [Agreia sp. COWG]|uniref:DUF3090 domain-containing protein n=1 Tax=Agreia sp. COWG TaxID=2773266 RepID=UPI0019278610|nr:DUF3090 domain-containing protein [Agreia sp. COWG]CAD6006116.1 conserved protein of unknown function [Agreia sp. COWG]